MEKVIIPISGVDTQVDEYSPNDGSCVQMDKFRPTGRVENPKWEIITEPNKLTYSIADEVFTEDENEGSFIKIAGNHYAFGKWYVAVIYNLISQPDSWYLSLCDSTLVDDVITITASNKLLTTSNGGTLNIDLISEVHFQDFGQREFYVLLSPGKTASENQHPMWRVNQDGAVPAVFRPELHLVQVTVNDETETKTDFDNKYPADRSSTTIIRGASSNDRSRVQGGRTSRGGTVTERSTETISEPAAPQSGEILKVGLYPGILKDRDKFFGLITAFRHPNGIWVKHSQPHVFKVTGQTADIGTNVEYATLSFGKNPEYDDTALNYLANAGSNFLLYGHYSAGFDWQRLGEVGIFMTTGKATREEAELEGTYYLLGTLDDEASLDWAENEEVIVTGEVLNIDPFSHHVITGKTISEYKNNLVLIRSVTNFSLPGVEYHSMIFDPTGSNPIRLQPKINEDVSGQVLQGLTVLSNDDCLIRVKIDTSKGIFYRWNRINLLYIFPVDETRYIVYFSSFQSYPDTQATQIDLYWYDSVSTEYVNFYTTELKPHPFLNMAYSGRAGQLESKEIIIATMSTAPIDISEDNSKVLVEENEFKVSDLTRMHFPLEWSYQIGDDLNGVVNNTDEVGSGQFGDYPLYVMGENKIYGARSGEGILVTTFDLISDKQGLRGFNAYAIDQNTLFFISKTGIHALRGRQIDDIDSRVDKILDSPVVTKPETQKPYLEASYPLFEEIISSENSMVGVSRQTKEIIFSSGSGLLIYNTKYNQWYTYSFYGIIQNPSSFPWNDRGGLTSMIQKSGVLSMFMSPYLLDDSFIYQWGVETMQSNNFSIITQGFVLNNYGLFKRIRQCVLQCQLIIKAVGSDPESGYYALNITLEGKRSTSFGALTNPNNPDTSRNEWNQIMSITDNTVKTINSKYIKSNLGSFQAFRLVINGENLGKASFIGNFLCEFDNRGRRFRI